MSFLDNFGPRLARFAFQPLELDAHINILYGSVRSGKTWAVHPKILAACGSPVKGRRLLTGVSKDTIYTNVLEDLFQIVGSSNYHYNSSSGRLDLLGSKWRVMGAKDEGSEKYVRGSTIGIAVADEITQMPQTFFEMLLTRLSPKGSRFYGTTNPDNPLHWLNKDYLDDSLSGKGLVKERILFSMKCTMDDNPNIPEEFKRRLKKQFKGMFYKRYILGLWVMAEGSIYGDSWDDTLYYDDSSRPTALFNQGGHVDRFVAVDCGVDHPQVYLEFWDDGDTVWIEKEYFWDSRKEQRQKTDGQYADDLIEFMGRNNACQVIIPPECASFEAECQMRGLWICTAENEVKDGISTVASLFANRKVRIHKHNCSNTMAQLNNYVWDPLAAKRGVEQPKKQDDDGPDCIRYGLKTKIPTWRTMPDDKPKGRK